MSERPGNVLACPNCLSPGHLGENDEGWRSVRTARMVDGRIVVDLLDHEVNDAERTSFFCSNQGCDPDESISEGRLVQLDRDGKPVAAQPEAQGRLA